MTGFTKISEDKSVSGFQKAAVLLGELGSDAGALVIRHLNLSDSEVKRLSDAFLSLGRYDPSDERQVKRELSVLQSLMDFGAAKGIYVPPVSELILSDGSDSGGKRSASLKDMVSESPDKFADILKKWINDSGSSEE